MKILILLLIMALIPVAVALEAEDSPYGLREDQPAVEFGGNYSINTNSSEIWVTNEGDMDNVVDLYTTLDDRYVEVAGDTMTGGLDIVMKATDTTGLLVDGSTNEYTGTSTNYGSRNTRDVVGSGSSGFYSYGFSNEELVNYAITGSPFSTNIYNYGGSNALDIYSAHSGTPFISINELNYGLYNEVTRWGVLTSQSTAINNYGMFNKVTDTMGFNNAGNSVGVNNYGTYSEISSAGIETAGTMTKKNYGEYITVSGSTQGTTTNYGLYLAGVSGADDNYAIWDASGQDWILDADSQKIFFGEGQDASAYYDGTNMVLDPAEVGSGAVQIVEGSDLQIGSTAADPTTSDVCFGDGCLVKIEESSVDVMELTGPSGVTFDVGAGSSPFTFQGNSEDLTLSSPFGNRWDWGTSTGVVDMYFGGISTHRNDNVKDYYGTSNDGSVYYDGENLTINPREVGTGSLEYHGSIQCSDCATSGTGIALMDEAFASGTSMAVGHQATATGGSSFAFGEFANATGNGGFAMGVATEASGDNSMAWGTSDAYGALSTSGGATNNASGIGCVALGLSNKCDGTGSGALGWSVVSHGGNSVWGLGQGFTNAIANSFAVGFGDKTLAIADNNVTIEGNLTQTGEHYGRYFCVEWRDYSSISNNANMSRNLLETCNLDNDCAFMPSHSGSITDINVNIDINGNWCSVPILWTPLINGASTSLNVGLNDTRNNYTTQARGTDTFSAGDLIKIEYNNWNCFSTGQHATVNVCGYYDD